MEAQRRMKKSAIGASSVTLIPATDQGGTSDPRPAHLAMTQIVITTPSTPPADFWGTVTTDGAAYEVIIRKVS